MPTAHTLRQRAQLKARLLEEGEDELAGVLTKCEEIFTIVCTKCGSMRDTEKGCKKRWCPVCQPGIVQKNILKVSAAAELMQWPLAVMLSARNEPEITGAIRALGKSLARFRRTDIWKERINGGVISLEVTNLSEDQRRQKKLPSTLPTGWHVHAHLLLDCKWLAQNTRAPRTSDSAETQKHLRAAAQDELSQRWAKCLHQKEAVVWVQRAYGNAMLEQVKYAVKASDLIHCSGKIGPLLREMYQTKMLRGVGRFANLTQIFEASALSDKEPCACEECGELASMASLDAIDHGRVPVTHAAAQHLHHNRVSPHIVDGEVVNITAAEFDHDIPF